MPFHIKVTAVWLDGFVPAVTGKLSRRHVARENSGRLKREYRGQMTYVFFSIHKTYTTLSQCN
jgi:hypothetical protein